MKGRREEAIILTNFEPSLAAKDPDYVLRTIMIYEHYHHELNGQQEVVFAKDAEIIRQMQKIGFQVQGQQAGFTVLRSTIGAISRSHYGFLDPALYGQGIYLSPGEYVPEITAPAELPGFSSHK